MAISYVNHDIVESAYILRQKVQGNIPLKLDGGVTVSQNHLPGKIKVEYSVGIGNESSAFSFNMKTITRFTYDDYDDSEEKRIREECLPTALKETRTDIITLLREHGIQDMVLPDFIVE